MNEHETGAAFSHQLCRRAEALLDLNRPSEAIPLARRAITADPQAARPRCMLTQALLGVEDLPGALQAAESAIQADPTDEWPHRLQSITLLRMGQTGSALEAARQAVRCAPQLPAALYTLASALMAEGEVKAARDTAELIRHNAPDDVLGHQLLAHIALHERRWRDAEAYCRHGLTLDPTSTSLLNDLASAQRHQGQFLAAIETYHAAARADPAAEATRKNLFHTVQGYLIGGSLAIVPVVVAGIVAVAAFGLRFGAHFLRNHDGLYAKCLAGVTLGGALLVGWFGWMQRRRIHLHPTVVAFYESEARRSQQGQEEEPSAEVALGLGVMIAFLFTLLWAADGWEGSGLNGWPGVVYIAEVAATLIGGILWVGRHPDDWWTRFRAAWKKHD